MNKKLISLIVLGFIMVGAGSFFGGMKYAESKNPLAGNFRNLTAEQRAQMGANGRNGVSGNRTGASFISGDIIAKDDKSITVKLTGGGSKIIFYSSSTQISKTATGTATDLEIGKTVTVNGSANQDGSVTAQTIQMRPEMKIQQ
jgi:hypothetical protein